LGNIAFNSYFGGRKMKIKEVILQANSFSGLKNFYVDVLGLMVLQEETNRISFEVG
jgi:catechol-2,3-dioxygenase